MEWANELRAVRIELLRLEYSLEYSNTRQILEVAGAKQTATWFLIQVCNKTTVRNEIMKPPQSLSLQMAERLLRAQPDSVANHHHSLLRHYYMRQHKSKRYKWQVHSKNIQKQRTTKKTAREHYRNIHKKINQQTEHKQLYCTYPHKTWPNGPFNVNTAWVSNHDTDCSISDRRALTWLATETGWARS